MKLVKRLVREEKGQGLVEYGLILALIVVVVIAAMNGMGTKIANYFTNVQSYLK